MPGEIPAEVVTLTRYGGYALVARLGLPAVPAIGQSILAGDGTTYRVVDVVWELTAGSDAVHALTVHVEKS